MSGFRQDADFRSPPFSVIRSGPWQVGSWRVADALPGRCCAVPSAPVDLLGCITLPRYMFQHLVQRSRVSVQPRPTRLGAKLYAHRCHFTAPGASFSEHRETRPTIAATLCTQLWIHTSDNPQRCRSSAGAILRAKLASRDATLCARGEQLAAPFLSGVRLGPIDGAS